MQPTPIWTKHVNMWKLYFIDLFISLSKTTWVAVMLIRIRYSSKRQQNSYFESFIRRNRKKWRFVVFLYLLNRPNFPKEENFLAVKISFKYDKRQSSTVFIWQCIYSWLLNQILFSLGLASNWDQLEIFRSF